MPEVAYKRAERIGQLLQQALAQLLVDGVMDPRVGFVTVTEVRVTDDLKNARVYVSIYGDEAKRRETLAGLRDAAGFIKREVSHKVRLRYMPHLSFAHDATLDQAERLNQLMNAIAEGAHEIPAEQHHELAPVETVRTAHADAAVVAAPPPEKPRSRRARRGRARDGRSAGHR